MDRNVRRVSSKALQDDLLPFSSFDDVANVVLLGDPGAGKTHAFREAAQRCGGLVITARAFLIAPAAQLAGPLFIDGLDERRAGRGDLNTVDALVEKLLAVGPKKVRISCRVADWLGESDLAALSVYFGQDGEPAVLHLDRLTGDEQRNVLRAEGLGDAETETFRREAAERGLAEFLDNPQNLIMLARAVKTGTWPATRKELFELATKLMLAEPNAARARSGSGAYTADELRATAGAACAARLISDVDAIGLADGETRPEIPSYRSIALSTPELTIAALGRRVFVGGPLPETVDYAHRTTAEFLGGQWLAEAVRAGMPLGRLRALIGVDGHPAPELRGLHAWLAVHLPEHAAELVDADPYGVLAYGDAASLSRSSCSALVSALGRLSQANPWFRSGTGQSPAIAALARPDLEEELRAVLRSADASDFGVQSIVVDALALGAPLPGLKDDLATLLERTEAPFAQRVTALAALLRIEPGGRAAAEAAHRRLGSDFNAFRLRAEMIRRMYGAPFGAADVVSLLEDLVERFSGDAVSGFLYALSLSIPVADIPAVLEGLSHGGRAAAPARAVDREAARFIDRILARAWRDLPTIEPDRGLRWLQLRHARSSGHAGTRREELRAALLERNELLSDMADRLLAALAAEDPERWIKLRRFREATLWTLNASDLLAVMRRHLSRAPADSAEERFLFDASCRLAFELTPPEADASFGELSALADRREDLQALLDDAAVCWLPTGYLRETALADSESTPEELRAKFEAEAEEIRRGGHLGWLGWAAKVYFGLFSDSNESAAPRERLVAVLGEANAETALAGFVAALSRPDLPSLAQVLELAAQAQVYDWWHALAAGLREHWGAASSLAGFSDDFLQAMVVFDLGNSASEVVDGAYHTVVPNWKEALLRDRPELVRLACLRLARAQLSRGAQNVDGLHELLTDEALRQFRGETALELLRDFPHADRFRLAELLTAAVDSPDLHSRFQVIADPVLGGVVSVGPQQYDRWLVAAYVLWPDRYEALLSRAAAARPQIVFDLRDRTEPGEGRPPVRLSLRQLEFLAQLVGSSHADASSPSSGWRGNTAEWDAAAYCRRLIESISTTPSPAAAQALARLEAAPPMASYRLHLRHAIANQDKLRRERDYDRPDWADTLKALANGAPATVSDLHQLVLDQLHALRTRVTRDNADLYKAFWNVDSYSRPRDPRPEEACRDTLITLLRPALAPKGVTVEPEGHMARDRRADFSAAMPGRKIPCELKRDYHADLWTAAETQLERFYAHDPEAKGFGVYGVLWFGDGRPTAMPRHPEGLSPPSSAAELEAMLRDRLPAERRSRLAVVVIDVSGSSP